MSALQTEVYSSQELERRLERWANWARSPIPGSGSTAIGYMRERLDRAIDSAEMDGEIAVTEKAVARAKRQELAYWRIIAKYYLGRLSLMEIAAGLTYASRLHVSDDSLKRLLESAKACVHGHILDIERGIDIDGFRGENRRV